jgi:hypothetical protein
VENGGDTRHIVTVNVRALEARAPKGPKPRRVGVAISAIASLPLTAVGQKVVVNCAVRLRKLLTQPISSARRTPTMLRAKWYAVDILVSLRFA